MTQTVLFLALHLVGTVICLAIGPRRRVALCCALGFSIGLAVMVAGVLLLCSTGVPYTRLTAGALAAALIAASLWRLRGRGLDRRERRVVALWTAAFTAGAFLTTLINLSFLTYDSHTIVMFGGAVFDDHGFAPGMIQQLSDWGVFQSIAHSGVGFTHETYLYALSLVFGLSAIPVFALLLGAALDALGGRGRGRRWLIALVTLATFSTYMLLRHFFYLHTNLGSAIYLFEFIALWWLAEVGHEPDGLGLAFVALLALALHRIEHPVICAVFLALTVLSSQLPARRLLVPLGLYSLAVVGWCALLATQVSPASEFLTPTKCLGSAAVVVAFYGYAALSLSRRLPFTARLDRWLPALAAHGVAAGLVFAFATRPEHMRISIEPWYENLWRSEAWFGVWPLLIGMAICAWFLPSPPSRAVFVWGIPIYFALIVLLVYGRTPYRVSNGDSGTRMALHLIPITLFYFGLKLAPLVAPADEAAA